MMKYHTLKRGNVNPKSPKLVHRIAYTETTRGLNDEIPTLLFIGAPWLLLKDVCEPLCRMMTGHLHDITLRLEHACIQRNGHHYWRIAVGIIGLDEAFISMKEFICMLLSKMEHTATCNIKRFNTEPFLNL